MSRATERITEQETHAPVGVISHYVRSGMPGKQLVMTVCGEHIDPRDHRNAPTCPDCQEWLRESEEMTI